MQKFKTTPLYLRRVDSDRNMARFYILTIQPTLFGGASLIRHWGRIGARGRGMVETFDDVQKVENRFVKLACQKQRKGYIAIDAIAEARHP